MSKNSCFFIVNFLSAQALFLAVSIFNFSLFANDEFSLRKKYPSLPIVTTEVLNKKYTDTYIVDVRSKFEFDILHIRDAHHISVTNMGFIRNLEKLSKKFEEFIAPG